MRPDRQIQQRGPDKSNHRSATASQTADAELRQIAAAWPLLKPHVREAIFTLIDAALSQQGLEDKRL
jgi:hypothetical protein